MRFGYVSLCTQRVLSSFRNVEKYRIDLQTEQPVWYFGRMSWRELTLEERVMLNILRVATPVAAVATSGVSAQTYLDITFCQPLPGIYYVTADLQNPEHEVLAVLADFQFMITGENITTFVYNDAYDSVFFGPAEVTITATSVVFRGGNVLPPLNNPDGPDPTNPLHLFTLYADDLNSFELLGQNTGAYVPAPGSPFPRILTYQNASGAPGDTSFEINSPLQCNPSNCPGDINGDRAITPADLTAWISKYNNGSLQCDMNFDGQCTPTDFTAWIALYNAGC